eukprot:Gregarina_sp_Poly_1__329@NODE_107_length_14129_cov_139_662779_g94_i0_p16_GENE_NODE_107_length_14129_cov_139_662779_g94_i0NODE_107_length_14129_cov_139_662779_g94_i0_p16_ORF_typecomplete_len107_score14_70AAA_lid_3/PF17862_1/1_9e07Vps4_C/PF09336_10/0_15_NODE_107_length_14129_cov_139_662779_g94_i078038123
MAAILTQHAKSLGQGNLCGLAAEDLSEVSRHLEGYNGSDLRAVCSRAAEFAYEDTVASFGGIDAVPSMQSFRPIAKADLLRALNHVKKSTESSPSFLQWTHQFGSN